MGNPKCKVIALGWLSDERFPRDHRHQPAASLANKIAGARKLLASATNAKLHQLACVVQCSDAEYPKTCTPTSSLLASRATGRSTVLSKSKLPHQTFLPWLPE